MRLRPWIVRCCTVAVFVLAVIAAVTFLPTSADAFAGVCSYYSDATYTTVVGARGTGCCGAVINWGVVTPYKRCQTLLCPDVVCPQESLTQNGGGTSPSTGGQTCLAH
jgi:uncharacterized protein DUF6289